MKKIIIICLILIALFVGINAFALAGKTVSLEGKAISLAEPENTPMFVIELVKETGTPPKDVFVPTSEAPMEINWTNFNEANLTELSLFNGTAAPKGINGSIGKISNEGAYLLGNEFLIVYVEYIDTSGTKQTMPLFNIGAHVQKGNTLNWVSPSKVNTTYARFLSEKNDFTKDIIKSHFYALDGGDNLFTCYELGKKVCQLSNFFKTTACASTKNKFNCLFEFDMVSQKRYLYGFLPNNEDEFVFVSFLIEFDIDSKDELIVHQIRFDKEFLSALKAFILETGVTAEPSAPPVVVAKCTDLPNCLAYMAKKAFVETGLIPAE